MKKTHQDRIKLIDRLERRHEEKVRLLRQKRQYEVKNMLRRMRGRDFDMNSSLYLDYIDGVMTRGAQTA